MEIKLSETGRNQLTAFLKLANRQQSQIVVRVMESQLVFQYIPIDHVNFVSLTLEKDNHVEMTNIEPQLYEKPFELSSKDFLKILTNIKKHDLLIHTQTAKDGMLLGLNFVIKDEKMGEVVKEIRIGIHSLQQQLIKDIKTEYDEKTQIGFDIEIETLLEKLTEIKEYEYEAVGLVTDWNTKTLELVCSDDHAGKKFRMILHNDVDFSNATLLDGTSIFTLNYLVTLLVTSPTYNTVRFVYAEDKPLFMKYVDVEDGRENMFVMLAQRKLD